MKNRMIKVAAVVPSLKVGDVAFNVREIRNAMTKTKDCGVVVFPELCITGYTCADLFGQSLLLDEAEKGLLEIASASEKNIGTTYVVSLPYRYNNSLYNVAAFVSEGKINGLIPKIHIPNYSEFYEERWFTSGKNISCTNVHIGNELVPFGTKLLMKDGNSGAILGTDICEDLWVADKPSTHACLAGANIIVNPSASDEVIGKESYRRSLVTQQSGDAYCAYIYCSAGMDESSTDLVFSGHCMIAENGTLLKESIFPDLPSITTAIVDLEKIAHNRAHSNTFETVNETSYSMVNVSVKPILGKDTITVTEFANTLKKENVSIARIPFVPQDDEALKERCEAILKIQANGLATRVRATGIHTLVIGISGGLDSTLALLVCHEARKMVEDIRILAYTMPVKGNTSSQTYHNAMALMKALHAEIREFEIGDQVNAHLNALGHGTEYKGEGDTTYENAQARMRTYILMDAANMENGLVIGTGDLSELALGWCTYNGDHMSMYAVNTSVPKTLVKYICRAYALTCGDNKLKKTLLDIIDTPISPELTPSNNGKIAQKTEEKIGKYDLNDFFLYWFMRYGMEPEKILSYALVAYPEVSKNNLKEALIRFLNRFFHQQFKRSCLPDGPKVGSVTLSPRGDWRMPSDASVNLWIENVRKA